MTLVALHPESIPGRPEELRWVIPAGLLCCTGRVTDAPAGLGDLIADGSLTEMVVEADGIRIGLAPGRSWRVDGPGIRSALHAALENPGAWRTQPGGAGGPDGRGPDERLLEIAAEVLDGAVGDFIRSHGGRPSVSSVEDGVLAISLRGACSGCPAVGFTLTARIERAVRERYPELRAVVAV